MQISDLATWVHGLNEPSVAMRSRELDSPADVPDDTEALLTRLETPSSDRFDLVLEAFRRDASVEELEARTAIDPWFLRELRALAQDGDGTVGLVRSYRSVDTCAAEFEAATPYYYSGHERTDSSEVRRGDRASVVILGSGPNRIGQGIEFDYCCVHAAMTVRESGRDAVMINCNPETVSTDYDTSDRLYFEPLTAEDVLAVIEVEQPEGVIVQFGGQTPLRLAAELEDAGVRLLGTAVDAIDLAEDRGRFGALLRRLEIAHPPYGTALSADEAVAIAEDVGFPLLVRPSYVLGGRAMEICYSQEGLAAYLEANVKASQEHPLLLDRFLEEAIEVDVDALCDGEQARIGGIMQHVEEAGVHSGDSACVIPPLSLGAEMLEEIRSTTERIALELGVIGLINIQYAIAAGRLYVIEANPRASRTIPFVSKAIGAPLAKIACRLMLGESLADQHIPEPSTQHVSVKEAVLPFARFAGADTVLGPEMKSTGEVMGIAPDFPTAFGKAQAAAGVSPAGEGHDLHHGHRHRQARRDPARGALSRHGLRGDRDARDGAGDLADGDPGQGHQQDRRRLTPRRRLHPLRRGRHGDQHADRQRRALGRLRDPQRRGPSWAALHHDDDRRLRGGASDRGAAVERPRAPQPSGAPRGGRRSSRRGRARKPRGRRRDRARPRAARPARVRGQRAPRERWLRRLLGIDAEGPEPRAGQFYMLAGEPWEGEGGRPYLARAFSVAMAERRADGVQLDFLVEDVGPGTGQACGARARGLPALDRAARDAVLVPGRARAGRRRRHPRRRGHRHRAAGDPAPRPGCRRGVRPAPCSASATRRIPVGSSSSTARRSAWRARMGTPATRATSPTCSR